MSRSAKILSAIAAAVILGFVLLVYGGAYNVAADQPHTALGGYFFETVRERSIDMRSGGVDVPDLSDGNLIASGAEHYDAMCTGCHLAPGMENTELRAGLLPTPPNLAEHGIHDAAEAFWVTKHGVKMTGMPAWGKTHDDDSIWGLVAFTQQLPEMSAEEYQAMVSAGGGHDHGSHDHGAPQAMPESGGHDDDGGHSHAAPDSPTAVVDAFHHALEEGKGDAALEFLAGDVLILEGGHTQTREEYAGGHLGSDMKFLAAMSSERLSREIRESGEQVTIITQTRLHGTYGDKEIDIVSSETAVVAQRDGEWKIVHLHWSS